MWKDLTLQQKAEIMKMSVANGVTDINDIQQLYDDSVGHRFDDAGRIITLADLPREYVQKYGHINVVTPKGVRMPLSQAYRDYNQTPINVNDVPGLTDYLIKQDQPDISEQAHINKVAADRFVHQLGEERDKALIGLAAAITGGGALASGLALAPAATIGSTIGGIAGEKLFNTGYEKLTGNNWGQDIEKWTNGYIPAEYGEYLNPGTLVGGIAEEPLRKFIGRSAYKGFLSLPQTKRAVEVAMRTTGIANPLEEMSAHINYLTHAPEGKQQVKDVLHYIATGKRQADRPYRSLNSQGDVYAGLIGDYPEEFEYEPLIQIPEALSKDIGNDYIDAYLYGKQMSPKLFNYKGTSDKVDNVFKEYVNTVYPNKKVQVYEAPIPHNTKAVNQNELTNIQNHGVTNPMRTNDPRVVADTSGHLMYTANMDGANPEIQALKEADIWKFNPADYKKKYELNSSPTNIKQKIVQKLIDTGLKIVDDIGNPVIVETPWYAFKDGGHLYKNAGPLNKKQAPKYRYGLIEQALVEGGAGGKFKVTSGKRKPNEAGNKGNNSAHTYTLDNGDPAAIDIVPLGITGQELLDIMTSPLMQATLSKYGFDILNESSKEMMAQTNATGQHLHVGKGIKGQKGKGQVFGGNVWGAMSGDTRGIYASRGSSSYANIPSSSTQSSEPFGVKAPKEEINPWIKFLAEMQQSTRPASPAQEEATSPTLTAQSSLTDFSSLNTDPRVEEAIQQANSQPALAYMPDITSDPLWNDTYSLFEPNTLANGGHLFYPGGQMLLKDNAINPALQYIYGPEYETIVKQNRRLRTKAPVRISSQKLYSTEQKSDNTANVVRPYKQKVKENVKAYNPKRQAKEQEEADIRQREYLAERQGSIGMPSNTLKHPDYNATKASEVQALREKEAQENKNAYFRRVAEQNILEGMEAIPWPSTIAGAYYSPNTHWYDPFSFLSNLYAKDNRGFFNYNQTTRDFYDANPEIGSAVNLLGDFVVPGAAAKVLKGAGRVGKFAAADIGDAWKTMRYELAHPEAQTLGIIPDRLNPFIGKKTYDKKINQVQNLIQKHPTSVNVTLDLPNAKVPATLGTGYNYRKGHSYVFMNDIKVPYYETDFTGPIPMEQGFTLLPGDVQTGINWGKSNRVYTPDKVLYDSAIPDGVSGRPLQVKNVYGDVRGIAPVNVEDMLSAVFPEGSRFSSPMFQEIRYNFDGTRPAMKDIGRINMRGEQPINGSTTNYRMFDSETRASLPSYLPKDHEIRVAAKQYVDDLERRLIGKDGKPIASVEGSYRAVSEGLPHSPQDVEFLVPEGNVEALKKLFNVRTAKEMPNGFGLQVTSKEFDELLEKTADFQVIRKGKGGGATGNTAWQIYEYLHPKEAQELSRNYIRKVAKNERSQAAKNYREAMELPLSPQELFDEYMASGLNKKKYLFDMMGSPKSKHVARKNSMGLGVGSDSKAYYDALVEKIHSEFPGAKTLAEQGYKLDYTNVDANKKFLEYWGLPTYYADKPEQMRIIVEQQMHAYQTVHRGTNIAIPGQSGKSWVNTPVDDRLEETLKLNVDAGGGSSAGPGLNTTNQINKITGDTGLTRETEIARQLPLTYKQEVIDAIKNPEDLVNRMKTIKEVSIQNESRLRAVNNLQQQDEMNRIAHEIDLPFWTEDRGYGSSGHYVGVTGYEDIASAIRYNGDARGGAFEITKPFNFDNNYQGRWLLNRAFEEDFYTNLMNAAESNPELLSLVQRREKLFNMRNTLNKKRNRTTTTLAAVKYGGTSMGAVGGVIGGAIYMSHRQEKEHAKKDPLWFKELRDYYSNKENILKTWDVNKTPNDEQKAAIETVRRYKEKEFAKMSTEEKIKLKEGMLKELRENADYEANLYTYGLDNGRSVEQITNDLIAMQNSPQDIEIAKSYLSSYEAGELEDAKTTNKKKFEDYRNKAIENAKALKEEMSIRKIKRKEKK